MNPWHKVTEDPESLPPEGKYVLVHLTIDNWIDSEDPTGVYCVVAKLRKGISKTTRAAMRNGELHDPIFDFEQPRRSHVETSADEAGNNKRPYCWNTFGGGVRNGQDVDYWMYIPKIIN